MTMTPEQWAAAQNARPQFDGNYTTFARFPEDDVSYEGIVLNVRVDKNYKYNPNPQAPKVVDERFPEQLLVDLQLTQPVFLPSLVTAQSNHPILTGKRKVQDPQTGRAAKATDGSDYREDVQLVPGVVVTIGHNSGSMATAYIEALTAAGIPTLTEGCGYKIKRSEERKGSSGYEYYIYSASATPASPAQQWAQQAVPQPVQQAYPPQQVQAPLQTPYPPQQQYPAQQPYPVQPAVAVAPQGPYPPQQQYPAQAPYQPPPAQPLVSFGQPTQQQYAAPQAPSAPNSNTNGNGNPQSPNGGQQALEGMAAAIGSVSPAGQGQPPAAA